MMYDVNDNKKDVQHYHTDDAHKKLGVMIVPDDNNSQQVDRMCKLVL